MNKLLKDNEEAKKFIKKNNKKSLFELSEKKQEKIMKSAIRKANKN